MDIRGLIELIRWLIFDFLDNGDGLVLNLCFFVIILFGRNFLTEFVAESLDESWEHLELQIL